MAARLTKIEKSILTNCLETVAKAAPCNGQRGNGGEGIVALQAFLLGVEGGGHLAAMYRGNEKWLLRRLRLAESILQNSKRRWQRQHHAMVRGGMGGRGLWLVFLSGGGGVKGGGNVAAA